MKLFYTNASAKAEIGEMETKISTLETEATTNTSEIARLTAELATANESLAAMTTERDEAAKAVEAAEASATKANADLTAANAKLATFDADVENAAQAKFASLGGSPIAASARDEKQDAGSMTMVAFNAMTPAARMAHVKAGGKLTE